MANFNSGTFTTTGTTDWFKGSLFDIAMNYAGVGSVDIERKMPDGDAIKIETAITADYNEQADFVMPVSIRLNCTDATANIEWFVQTTRVRT